MDFIVRKKKKKSSKLLLLNDNGIQMTELFEQTEYVAGIALTLLHKQCLHALT